MSEFVEMIKEEVKDRIRDRIGQSWYGCDLGFALTEGENANGSWYCSRYKAKEDIKKYFDEYLKFAKYYHEQIGETIYFEGDPEDYQHDVECVHCNMMIMAVESVFSQAFDKIEFVEDCWNNKFEVTEDFVNELCEKLEEIEEVW